MAERLRMPEHSPEKPEHIEVHVERKEHLSSKEKAEAAQEQKHSAEEARESIEKLAVKTSEAASKKEGVRESEDAEAVHLNKSYKSVMNRVESQLPAYQRVFSRVLRNPNVDKASVIVGGTIARPSGIIGAAGLAFVGMLVFGFTAKSVGFELPNSIFVFLVIAGWTIGLLLDFIYTTIRRMSRAR